MSTNFEEIKSNKIKIAVVQSVEENTLTGNLEKQLQPRNTRNTRKKDILIGSVILISCDSCISWFEMCSLDHRRRGRRWARRALRGSSSGVAAD